MPTTTALPAFERLLAPLEADPSLDHERVGDALWELLEAPEYDGLVVGERLVARMEFVLHGGIQEEWCARVGGAHSAREYACWRVRFVPHPEPLRTPHQRRRAEDTCLWFGRVLEIALNGPLLTEVEQHVLIGLLEGRAHDTRTA